MSKRILTSWWAGKHAPPPLPPSPVFAKIFFRFSGAKTAGKRFLLWEMGFSAAKIAPCPPYTPLGTIKSSRGSKPYRALLVSLAGCHPAWPVVKIKRREPTKPESCGAENTDDSYVSLPQSSDRFRRTDSIAARRLPRRPALHSPASAEAAAPRRAWPRHMRR